jgi:hypothetical protein
MKLLSIHKENKQYDAYEINPSSAKEFIQDIFKQKKVDCILVSVQSSLYILEAIQDKTKASPDNEIQYTQTSINYHPLAQYIV